MEIEYSGVDESLIKWRYNTEPWHTAYITDLIAKWESDKAKENTFVKHMSTVAVRPVVNGHWIEDRNEPSLWSCSICETVIYSEHEEDRLKFHKWCGCCGAEMRGDAE